MTDTSTPAHAQAPATGRPVRGEPRSIRGMVQLAARMAVVLLLIGGLLATSAAAAGASSSGIGAVAAAPAVASAQLAKTTASCGGGRCTGLSRASLRARHVGNGTGRWQSGDAGA